jgi:hypothetical protein
MEVKAKDGKSGWTLCGKFDRERAGSKYLAQGFGRSPSGATSMSSLDHFEDATDGARWVSIDCRPIVQDSSSGSGDGSTFMMHAGSNDGDALADYHFTNVLEDAREDATNLFDMARKDEGTCVAQEAGKPESGGIITYSKDWGVYTDNWSSARGSEQDRGGCLSGDGQ